MNIFHILADEPIRDLLDHIHFNNHITFTEISQKLRKKRGEATCYYITNLEKNYLITKGSNGLYHLTFRGEKVRRLANEIEKSELFIGDL